MTNTQNTTDITLQEQKDILEKLNLLKNALWLDPTTEDEMLEIAKRVLEAQKTKNEE